nr:helix-turn-helix transcriptional regulator [Sedimentibacter sp.]
MRQERIKNKWTLQYVSKKVGVTKTTIHDIEIAKRRPSYEVLIKLENLFNLSHRDLFQQVPDENILSEK